jgi:hypothetical protein
MKFQVDRARAETVQRWAREHLAPDPYSRSDHGDGYRVHTLYFDTAAHDLFRRAPGHARHKFRIRRYGDEPVVYLERKTRVGDRVVKRRTKVGYDELGRLLDPRGDAAWHAHWYWRRLALRALRPSCRLSYDRAAFVTSGPNGTIRLTLDRAVACAPADKLVLEELSNGQPVLDRAVILELKFRVAMPAIFKRLLEDVGLAPRATSKYRLGLATFHYVAATSQNGPSDAQATKAQAANGKSGEHG